MVSILNKYSSIFLLIGILIGTPTANAQTYKSNSWAANLSLGASNMMSDLGGSNFIGSRGLFDYDLKATRLAISTGIAVNTGAFSFCINIMGTRLVGDDSYSDQEFQVARNLSVRTDLVEASFLTDFRPFSRSQGFNRFYLYGGIGLMYYQPKAKLNDDWVKLRTLGTEGQYLTNGDGPYSELDLVLPYGLGYKFRLAKSTSLVLDLGFRKTFTDYLDDVSTVYADHLLLSVENGTESAVLADRSLAKNALGYERGNPEKDDMYFILGLKFEYILGGKAGDGCYYNRNPPKTRSTRINQRKMFTR
ncbi:hypothetical protein N8368_04710 [Bacteroidia bacterium]|nr:hypothetical protein [Bacteroidia bacterium]MDC1395787.1 hypothetical protein [Bacteroidia bacterium]